MFEKRVVNAEFYSPLKDFSMDTQTIEYRKDPLFSTWCRINVNRTERVKQWKSDGDIGDLIEKSKMGCFFCTCRGRIVAHDDEPPADPGRVRLI